MITNTISIEKVKKNVHFFTRGELGGHNQFNFNTIKIILREKVSKNKTHCRPVKMGAENVSKKKKNLNRLETVLFSFLSGT